MPENKIEPNCMTDDILSNFNSYIAKQEEMLAQCREETRRIDEFRSDLLELINKHRLNDIETHNVILVDYMIRCYENYRITREEFVELLKEKINDKALEE